MRYPQDYVAFCGQPSIATAILNDSQCVLTTVYFNDESVFETCKVGNIAADSLLSPKLETVEFSIPQFLPENPLRQTG